MFNNNKTISQRVVFTPFKGEKRLINFLNTNLVKPVGGAAVDAGLRTPVSAALDAPTGIAAKTVSTIAQGVHKSVVQQFAWNSLTVIPVIGRFRGALMNTVRNIVDPNASPILHPFTRTIPNMSTNLHKSIDRVLGGLLHGDKGPSVDTLGGSRAAIKEANDDYTAKKTPDPRDNELSVQALPILGAPSAILGGAKELFIDTSLEILVDGVGEGGKKLWNVCKNTFSKMFLNPEGEKLSILRRVAKVPLGFASGLSEFTFDAEQSPMWHLIKHTAPNAVRNATMAATRGLVGPILGDPGEQVVVGEGVAKARGMISKASGVSKAWLGKAGSFLKGVGSGGGGGATPAAPPAAPTP